jgi:hypothetical protein
VEFTLVIEGDSINDLYLGKVELRLLEFVASKDVSIKFEVERKEK